MMRFYGGGGLVICVCGEGPPGGDSDGEDHGPIARLGQSLSNLGVHDGRDDDEGPGPLPGHEDMQG